MYMVQNKQGEYYFQDDNGYAEDVIKEMLKQLGA